jgi:hypothetical protein
MMVDDAHFDETFEYFERICHTRLKRDWLRQVLRYVLQFSSPVRFTKIYMLQINKFLVLI